MILHSKVYGEGSPIIILHGLLGSLDNWQTVSKFFGQKYQVITLDARNHGRSQHLELFSYEAMVQDVIDTMESMSIQKAHFIGHSMGGKTAMHLSLMHPEKVDKLVVVDIAPVNYESHHQDVFDAIYAVPLQSISQRADAEAIISSHIDEYDVVQFIMKGLYRNEENQFAWRYNVDDIYQSYDQIIGFEPAAHLFEGPVLFLKGSNSKYIQSKDWTLIQDYFPNASLHVIEGAGHWLHAEKPQEFIQSVSAFLQD